MVRPERLVAAVEGVAGLKILTSSNGSREAHARTVNVDNSGGLGRWPANVLLSEDQAAALDAQSGIQRDGVSGGKRGFQTEYVGGEGKDTGLAKVGYGSGGGASRFFYVAKAPKSERPNVDGVSHPTVKPLALMRWLIRLVTPPGGTVLEPFAGSGATVEAAILEGFDCIAIEREAEYLPLILERIRRQREAPAAPVKEPKKGGRWPANVILDRDQADALDQQSGVSKSSAKGSAGGKRGSGIYAQDSYTLSMERTERPAHGDEGGASRFFTVIEPEPLFGDDWDGEVA